MEFIETLFKVDYMSISFKMADIVQKQVLQYTDHLE